MSKRKGKKPEPFSALCVCFYESSIWTVRRVQPMSATVHGDRVIQEGLTLWAGGSRVPSKGQRVERRGPGNPWGLLSLMLGSHTGACVQQRKGPDSPTPNPQGLREHACYFWKPPPLMYSSLAIVGIPPAPARGWAGEPRSQALQFVTISVARERL